MRLTVRALLERGYFPKELPSCFTTRSFARVAGSLASTSSRTTPGKYTLSRPGGLRRSLAIVDPYSQLGIVREISSGWGELQRHFARSDVSLSAPVTVSDRCLGPATSLNS